MNKNQGFTILEFLIVIGIIVVIGGLTIPVGVDFFQSEKLDTTYQKVLSLTRLAQHKALMQERKSEYGIKITSSTATLYKGTSFQSRDNDFDLSVDISSTIEVSPTKEIHFNNHNGKPDSTADFTFSVNDKSQSFSIKDSGLITSQ